MKPLLLVLPLTLTAAGCATAPRPVTSDGWSMQVSATAGAAIFRAVEDREVLRLACRRNPADLMATTPLLRGAGPVRLEVGSETYGLTGQPGAPQLTAEGPIPETLPSAITSGGEIALSQGGRRIGPYPPPDPKTAAAFAIACRGTVG